MEDNFPPVTESDTPQGNRSLFSNLFKKKAKGVAPIDTTPSTGSMMSWIHADLSQAGPSSSTLSAALATQLMVTPNILIHPVDTLSWMKDKGYEHVLPRIKQMENQPWFDEIRSCHHPYIVEQLADLFAASKNHPAIMRFGLNLAKVATSPARTVENMQETHFFLGACIFLADRHTADLLAAIQKSDLAHAFEKIDHSFITHTQALNGSPVDIAQSLITSFGSVNTGMTMAIAHRYPSSSYLLRQLDHSPLLRGQLENIQAPPHNLEKSNQVIRETLHLHSRDTITLRDARVAALSALLSHPRQGAEGSCFAVSLVIELLAGHLSFCLTDLKQLIEEGKLTRKVKNSTIDFPFLSYHKDDRDANPLLKVWENTIANMAENQEGGLLKRSLMKSVLNALQFRLGELQIPPNEHIAQFFLFFEKNLFQRAAHQFDTRVHLETPGYSKEGGYMLYDTTTPIDSSERFRTFIANIIQESYENVLNEQSENSINQTKKALDSYLQSEAFLRKVLEDYHPLNKGFLKHHNIDELLFTPWITQTGNNSKSVLKVYLGADSTFKTSPYPTKKAEDALIQFLELCQRMTPEEKERYRHNPNKRKPTYIPGKHRFSAMPGYPSLNEIWSSGRAVQECIDKRLRIPGTSISDSIIESTQAEACFKELREKILPECFNKDDALLLSEQIRAMPLHISIKQYRKQVLSFILKKASRASTLKKFIPMFDATLANNLPPKQKATFANSLIIFGDTNWGQGDKDWLFSFVVNPGNGQIELWKTLSDGSKFEALDQDYWVNNQKWVYFDIPETFLKSDPIN